jgi:hypothetical protein
LFWTFVGMNTGNRQPLHLSFLILTCHSISKTNCYHDFINDGHLVYL